MTQDLQQLFLKYYGPGGRYGIYPTLSRWKNNLPDGDWLSNIKENYSKDEGVDLYIHIPFCESLCTFCGCNIKASRDHTEENDYVSSLLKEWSSYKETISSPVIRSIYLGGGTPTFLAPDTLKNLLDGIFKDVQRHSDFHGTIEADPRFLSSEQVDIFVKNKFNRISFGVQDFDQKVLENVNRSQSYEVVATKTKMAKERGIEEVFYDLIYGLPCQTQESILSTIEKLKELDPDGLALYPLAHVPWQGKAQQAFGIFEPLSVRETIKLLICADQKIVEQGFINLGMNYYAKSRSRFIKKKEVKSLKRTVMGYMPSRSNILIGLGVSAISHTPTSMVQNEKIYSKYLYLANAKKKTYFKSHKKDKREFILQPLFEKLICDSFLSKEELSITNLWEKSLDIFEILERDNIVEIKKEGLYVTPTGLYFLKNICQILERNSLS